MRTKRKLPPKSAYRDAMLENVDTANDYFNRLAKIATSLFEWTNLPSSMNARWLELTLFAKGQAALLWDETYGFINTEATDGGYINIYYLPTTIQCVSNGYNVQREVYTGYNEDTPKDQEAILVMNNYQRIPTAPTLTMFANRLAEAQRTADINIKSQRTPILIMTDEKQRFTMKNMYEQYDGNTPVIFGDKNAISPEALKVLKTDAAFIADKLMDYKREIWNEALSFLGISNLAEKKERLISSEVDSNNELINLNLQSYLAPRKQAAKEFNEKFGTNIDVKVRSDLFNVIKQVESITDEYRSMLQDEQTLKEGDQENG